MNNDIVKRTKIEIEVGLDENHVPIEMKWSSDDTDTGGKCKAAMLSLWDEEEENTMRIDLWEKDMNIYDMQRFFHQSLLTMADTYERATSQIRPAKAMREFAEQFAKITGLKG